MPTVGELIRTQRQRYGMAQKELAKRIGVTQVSLSAIERGETHDPHFSIVRRAAEVLKVDLNVFAQATP